MEYLSYRELYDALQDYEGNSAYVDVLKPWLVGSEDNRAWLREFSEREGAPIPPALFEELWELYALSSVCELLLLRFQDRAPGETGWAGPQITLEEFGMFVEALGLTVSTPATFSPFYHEVVALTAATGASSPARILAYRWPCVMLGNMILVRGGVSVSAGSDVLRPGIADKSALYWTTWRLGRPYRDLSQGWGHNSRWRTDFRRDYVVNNTHYFNVDGKVDLTLPDLRPIGDEESEPSLAERIELVTHRCYVLCTKPSEDLFPYEDRWTQPA